MQKLEQIERENAKERQGTRKDLQLGGKFPQSDEGKTRDKVGEEKGEIESAGGNRKSRLHDATHTTPFGD